MLKFVARVFGSFFEIFLWLNLIGSAIAGAVIGGGNAMRGENTVLGFVIGAIAGIITNIIFGGLISIFVNMGKDISELKNDVKSLASSLAGDGGTLLAAEEDRNPKITRIENDVDSEPKQKNLAFVKELEKLTRKGFITSASTPVFMDELEKLLRKGNTESLKFTEALRTLQGSEELIRQIEEFDFDDSVKTLTELKKEIGDAQYG